MTARTDQQPDTLGPCGSCGDPAIVSRSYWPGAEPKPRCETCDGKARAALAKYERSFTGNRSPWS